MIERASIVERVFDASWHRTGVRSRRGTERVFVERVFVERPFVVVCARNNPGWTERVFDCQVDCRARNDSQVIERSFVLGSVGA